MVVKFLFKKIPKQLCYANFNALLICVKEIRFCTVHRSPCTSFVPYHLGIFFAIAQIFRDLEN